MSEQTLEQEVNKPKHYNSHESGIEAIEVTRYLEFDLGNAWKYCMRYRDKGTPKKDLKKAIWYLNDYKAKFIDINNDSLFIHHITDDILSKMLIISECEQNQYVKHVFEQIILLVTQNGIVKPAEFDYSVYELNKFAETLN